MLSGWPDGRTEAVCDRKAVDRQRFRLLTVNTEVLTLIVEKSYMFWDITSSSPLKINGRFGGGYSTETSIDI
jgi:hypothetical protein